MQVINEKLVSRTNYTQALRALKPNVEVLVVDYALKTSFSTIAARLKRKEGLAFKTVKDGNDLKIQRIEEEDVIVDEKNLPSNLLNKQV